MVLKKTPRDLSFKHCQAVKMCALKQQKLFIAIYIFPMFICTCVCICAYMCAVSKSLTYSDTFFLRALYFSFLLRCTSRHKARQHKKKIRETRSTCACQSLWLMKLNIIIQTRWYMGIIYYFMEQLCEKRIFLCSLILLVAYSEEQRLVSYYLPE